VAALPDAATIPDRASRPAFRHHHPALDDRYPILFRPGTNFYFTVQVNF